MILLHVLIRVILPLAFSVVWAPVFSAEPMVMGIHAHYKATGESVQQTYLEFAKHCPGGAIVGPVSQLGTYVLDQYFLDEGGAYLAEYEEGYTITSGTACRFVVGPYKKIRLYHFGTRKLYEYSDQGKKGTAWTTRPLPGEKVLIATGDILDPKIGKVVPTGKTDKFAGLNCKYEELHTKLGVMGESCVTDDLDKMTVRFPKRLTLKRRTLNPESGDLMASREIVSIDFKAKLERSLFFPPESVAKASEGRREMAEPMRKWCEQQLKKTGVNPCADDPEDDEK